MAENSPDGQGVPESDAAASWGQGSLVWQDLTVPISLARHCFTLAIWPWERGAGQSVGRPALALGAPRACPPAHDPLRGPALQAVPGTGTAESRRPGS